MRKLLIVSATLLLSGCCGFGSFDCSGDDGYEAPLPDNPVAAGTKYYVDADAAAGGTGLSRETAFRTIQEGSDALAQAGDRVLVAPGTYREDLQIDSGGIPVTRLQTGVSVEGDEVSFPDSAELYRMDLAAHPGEYYLYLYRSAYGNSGYYPIKAVDLAARVVTVDASAAPGGAFRRESGVEGDAYALSTAIGRPVRVGVDSGAGPGAVVVDLGTVDGHTILYIGDYIDDYDAAPADFVLVEDLELTGSRQGGGVHVQSSSYVVLSGLSIHDTGTESRDGAGGVLINGNLAHPSRYCMVKGCEIFNTPMEGIYIGAGGHPRDQNHTHYVHALGNSIYNSGSAQHATLENAIDLKEYNIGAVIADNTIGRASETTSLDSTYNGAIELRQETDAALLYGNILRNLENTSDGPSAGPVYGIALYGGISGARVYNNIIRDADSLNFWAVRIEGKLDGTGKVSTQVMAIHNTAWNVKNGFFIEEYGTQGVTIANNILGTTAGGVPLQNYGGEESYNLYGNLYAAAPSLYAAEPSRWVAADLKLDATTLAPLAGSAARDQAVVLGADPVVYDQVYTVRDDTPNRGALE